MKIETINAKVFNSILPESNLKEPDVWNASEENILDEVEINSETQPGISKKTGKPKKKVHWNEQLEQIKEFVNEEVN